MVTTVKLNQIRLAKDWNRESVGDISSLVTSIKENGQLQPLLVWKDPTSKREIYHLIDGRRRFTALQVLKKDPIIVLSDATDESSAFLQSMAANLVREDNTSYEIARSFDQLVTTHGVLYDDIVKVCGKSAGYVSQHVSAIRLARCDDRLLEAFKAGKISLYMFRHLGKLDIDKDAKVFHKTVSDLLGGAPSQAVCSAIDQYVKRKAEQAQRKAVKQGDTSLPVRRGAAAHTKVDPTVESGLFNYDAPEIRKSIKKLKTVEIVERAKHFKEKFLCAKSLGMQRYYSGCLDALNFALGLGDSQNTK